MAWDEAYGQKVYQLDICDALDDHAKCPGSDIASVGHTRGAIRD
jgi:hypothetical protein